MASNVTEQRSPLAAGRICPQCNERMESRRCATCNVDTARLTALVDGDDTHKLVGQTIAGRYTVAGVLGRGGMGTVYRGIQVGIDRPVAIKVMSREISTDLESIKRFQREAKLTSRLTHPNTIRVYDFGMTDDDHLYLVMELLEGSELGKALEEEPNLPPERAVGIAIQILRALREAHERGIVHRDLKPDNVFLRHIPGEGEVVKVMDFGIAKSVRGDVSQVTSTGTLIGTPAYMSPEQARGEHLDGRSDIYTVGTMLFEMIAGQLPFPVGTGDSAVKVLIEKITRKPPTLAEIVPDVPDVDALSELIARFLLLDRGSRPRDAGSAIALLETWQKRDQTIVTPAVPPPPRSRPSASARRRQAVKESARTVASSPRPRPSGRRPASRPRPPSAPAPAVSPPTTMSEQAPEPAPIDDEPATVQYDTRSGQEVSASQAMAPAPQPSPHPLPTAPAQQGSSSGLIAIIAGGLLALLAVGGATWFALQQRGGDEPVDTAKQAPEEPAKAADEPTAKEPPAPDPPAADPPEKAAAPTEPAANPQTAPAEQPESAKEAVDAGAGEADAGAGSASQRDAGAAQAGKPVAKKRRARKPRPRKKPKKDKRDEFRMVD